MFLGHGPIRTNVCDCRLYILLGARISHYLQLFGFGISCFSFCNAIELIESPAFVISGRRIFWIPLDSLIVSLNGLVVLALVIENDEDFIFQLLWAVLPSYLLFPGRRPILHAPLILAIQSSQQVNDLDLLHMHNAQLLPARGTFHVVILRM